VQHLSGSDSTVPSDDAASLFGAAGDPAATPTGATRGSGAADRAADLAERDSLLAALARLLVEPGERASVLAHALEHSAHLVPAIERWQIFLADTGEGSALLLVAERNSSATAPGAMPASPQQLATLGLGASIDRQVFQQRQRVVFGASASARRAGRNGSLNSGANERGTGVCMPLIDYAGRMCGALVALARPGAALADADVHLLETVACHVTAILAQRTPPGGRMAHDPAAPDPRIEFISLAAHELRSPLTSVKGYAQLLLRAARKNPTYPENHLHALQSIEQQAARMSDIVGELLDTARIQRGTFELQPRPVDLAGLARRVVEQRQPALERHELRLETDTVALVGRWDPQRLEQVIRDLIDNAIRYSPDGGLVRVHVSHAEHVAHLCVHDEGLGVAPEERERIFEAFFRGAETRRRNLSGLGLGLFVSRAIVEQLGGHLWLESPTEDAAELRGSQFCFVLPLAGAESAPLA
jgi:signal transduction histidine kinase